MTTPEAQARIQILKIPVAAPGTCVVCGSPGDSAREFIDFGFTIDYFGVVYFCTICMVEIANACKFTETAKYQELLQQNQELRDALEIANRRIESLNETLRSCFAGDSLVDTLRDVSDSGEVSQASTGNTDSTAESSSNSNKSSSIEEFGNLLSSSSDSNPSEDNRVNPLEF